MDVFSNQTYFAINKTKLDEYVIIALSKSITHLVYETRMVEF